MAQFIVQKLEENKQAKWLDITVGKFELTEWHRIAEEWFKEKPRNSDQVDAPCMLRKGLPRAFPGLDEVKGESVKEGTQYRSRVFQAPPALVQEVQLYVSKPMMQYPSTAVGPDMSSYSSHMAMQMSYPQTSNGPTGYNYVMAGGGGMHSPGTIRMKTEPDPVLDVGGSPASSDQASPYTFSSYDGLQNGGGASMVAPPMITDSPVAASDVITAGNGYHSPYNRGQSPYSMESTSPAHNPATPYQQAASQMLQVPTSAGVGEVDVWSNGGSHHNSPRYSPDPGFAQDMAHQPLSPPVMLPSQLSPGPGSAQQLLVDVKAYPDQSPLEGGGQLALLFSGTLPPGPKWLSFISHTRPEYVHQVEAIENNAVALTTIIPKHDIPETMNLQVMCGGQVIASTEFTYYASAQYHSDLLFQYLTQTFPSYFPDVGSMGGDLGPDGGGADGLGGGGYGGGYFGGNIPSSSYSLLLGACRLGIEPLIFATLELPSMLNITRAQLTKAKELAEEHGHLHAAKVLGIIAELPSVTVKGGEGQEEKEQILANEKSKDTLKQLDNVKDNLKACGQKILDNLARIYQMERRVKDEEERDSANSTPVHRPTSASLERSDSASSETRRRHSANKLQRQDESVREDDEPPQTTQLSPPVQIHSRASISEQDDHLPPLRPTRSIKSRSMAQKKMLVASYSDAADSAVSMSFDHDLEQEVLRRNSASLVSSGLYSLNSSVSQQLLSITIQAQEGDTFANSLQYECVYQVTEDFPPNSDSSNVVFKSGDRIYQVGDQFVRDKGPEEFAELLRSEAAHGTTVKILPQLSSGSSVSSVQSLGYSSLDVVDRKNQLVKRQSDRELASSLTTKVSNLLTMKASTYPRSITVPFLAGEGWGFEVTGGNAVGIFISKVSTSRKELQVGDQVLELGGQTTNGMSHFEASSILKSSKDKIQLRVVENIAKFTAIKDQFELESYYVRSHADLSPSDSKDMLLKKGGIVRVVNTVLFPGYWLAWSVDPNTGMDLDLRRIPSPSAAKHVHGKDIYEAVNAPAQQNITISAS